MKDRNWRGDSSRVKRSKKIPAPLSGLLVNVADSLDVSESQAIAEICLEDFLSDAATRTEWDSMHADWVTVYNQADQAKNPPWQDSSNESLGLLTEACNSFQARAYKAFFPTRMPISAIPVGRQSEALTARAKRVAKFLQWSLFVKDQQYKEDKSAMLLRVAIHGSDFSKTYFDPVMNRIMTRCVRAEDLFVPYSIGPVSIDEVPRKTELIHPPINDGRIRFMAGYYSAIPEPMVIGEIPSPQRDAQENDTGIKPSSTSDESDLAQIIEQHRDLDIDGDGIAEPYIVWIDVTSRKLLRIEVRYEVDDRGQPTNGRLPIEQYTHYRFLVNPNGFYGYGLGFLLGKTNIAINKLLRQFIDATTLSIHGNMSGFVSDQLNVNKGDMKITLGSFKTVSASTEDIQKGIKTLSFPPPPPTLMQAVAQLEQRAQRIGATTDATSGDISKVMQPTTVMTMVEQGLMVFTSIQEFLLHSWSRELGKIYRLNSLYFRGEEWFASISQDGAEESFVKEEDFADDMMIIPVADPRLASQQQRLQKAQFLYDFALKNPLIANNPAILLKISRRLLDEMEFTSIDELLPKDAKELPPPPPDPKVEALKMKVQADQEHNQGQLQVEGERLKMESAAKAEGIKLDREKAVADAQAANAKLSGEARLQAMKLENDKQLALMKLDGERQLAELKLASEQRLAREKLAGEQQLAREKAASDAAIKREEIAAKASAEKDKVSSEAKSKKAADGSSDKQISGLIKVVEAAVSAPRQVTIKREKE